MDISQEIDEVLLKYPALIHHLESNSLSGELFLPDGDSYEIIMSLDNYPEHFPRVLETGGRIPKKLDRHIYTDTESCCFTTSAKAQVLLRTKITSLVKFVDEIVIRYFQNNSFYELNNKYCFEEYEHGSLGILQSYQDILGIKEVQSIIRLIIQRLKDKKLTIRDECYCGSKLSLKKCNGGVHCKNYRLFRMIDKNVLDHDLKYFANILN